MELIFQFTLLSIGLGLLWKVGEHAIANAVCFSNIFGISRFTVGFFLFAVSTGLPEISSAVISSINGIPELSAGDLMGSTFVNLSLILGLVIFLSKEIKVKAYLRKKLFWTSLLILIIFTGLVLTPNYQIISGISLVSIYVVSFFFFKKYSEKSGQQPEPQKNETRDEKTTKRPVISKKVDITIKLLANLAFLLISSWITVHAAASIAGILEVDISFIGASLIAIGTGLPEITLGVHAVKKHEYTLALGDIFGASLLNVSLVLGMLILVNQPIDLSIVKVIFPFLIGVIGWIFFRLIPKKPLKGIDSLILVGLFSLYLATLVFLQNGLLDW